MRSSSLSATARRVTAVTKALQLRDSPWRVRASWVSCKANPEIRGGERRTLIRGPAVRTFPGRRAEEIRA
jgi:hypothetical protein